MAIRFNFTNRIDLPDYVLKAKIANKPNSSTEFLLNLQWDLSEYEFIGDFVFVFLAKSIGETRRMVIPLDSNLSGSTEMDLTSMRNPLDCSIQMKLTRLDSMGIPVIVANLDDILPELPNSPLPSKSLLRTKIDSTLEVPWIMKFDEGIPTLCVTNQNELYEYLASKSPIFDALILPEVIRQVLSWIKFPGEEKKTKYVEAWKTVLEQYGCQRQYLDEEFQFADVFEADLKVLEVWAEQASIAFAKDFASIEQLLSALKGDQ